MISRRAMLVGAGSALVGRAVVPAAAQSWSTETVRVIVSTAAGGAPDVVGRLVGEKLGTALGKTFVIENSTQGGGVVGNNLVSRSKPDGSMFAMLTGGFAPQAALRKSLPYDPVEGFTFISTLCAYPMVLGVRADSEIKSFPDLLKRAKDAPGKLSYTITFPGTTHHLLGTWINMQAGTQMLPVPYRGAGPGFTDVLAGRVDVMVEPTTSAMPRIRAGQLRVLAVSSPSRYPLLPDAPAVAETLPGIEAMTWLGLAGAPGTPPSIVEPLNAEIRRALDLPDVRKTLTELGTIAMPSTPLEFKQRVEREIARWRDIIVKNNIDPV